MEAGVNPDALPFKTSRYRPITKGEPVEVGTYQLQNSGFQSFDQNLRQRYTELKQKSHGETFQIFSSTPFWLTFLKKLIDLPN